MELFFLLMFFHFLADYPLQGDFLSKAKNHRSPVKGVPWTSALDAHASIHAGFVLLLTGQLWATLVEYVAHGVIDYLKCEGKISYQADQLLHTLCKGIYALIIIKFNLIGGLYGALYV